MTLTDGLPTSPAFVTLRQTYSHKPRPPLKAALDHKTPLQSNAFEGNWRLLTTNFNGLATRYLVRRGHDSLFFILDIYDLRTGLCWRQRFCTQRERNSHLAYLRNQQVNHSFTIPVSLGPDHD